MMHCIASVVKAESVRGLYKGFGPNLAKTAPCAALSWWVYEASKARMGCPDIVHAHACSANNSSNSKIGRG